MKKTRISIITPSFNQGKYIEKTFQSILNQHLSPGDLQYILVDAISTDETSSLVHKYKPLFKKSGIDFVYICEKDDGQSDALNKGFLLANAEIVGYVNSDDFLEPYALKRVLQYFRSHTDVLWAFGGWNVVNEGENLYKSFQHLRFSSFLFRSYAFNIGQPSCFYKRALLKKVGYLRKDLHLAMDYDLWLRFLEYTEPGIIPHTLSNLRYYSGAKSAKFTLHHHNQAFFVALKYCGNNVFLFIHLIFRYIAGLIMISIGKNISQKIAVFMKK
ncbi:MAG: glycosyltransferase [Candidatus Pacebacteria bacterium]|nr:glycosyltransferase [Candidatus Paceibacterota bacterium]